MLLQNLQAELAELILSPEAKTTHIHPLENMIIYQNNRASTLKQTLENTYPLIYKLLGEDFFQLTAKHYIENYPSCSGDLHDYGEYFSDFLAEFPPLKEFIYIAEVGKFEWAAHCIYIAPPHSGFQDDYLRNLSAEDYDKLQFLLHPASCLLKFHYPILRIIDLCQNKIDSINVNEGGVNLLLLRREFDLALIPLSQADFIFLQHLQDEKTLAEALAATLEIDKEFKLEEKLPYFIQEKFLVECFVR